MPTKSIREMSKFELIHYSLRARTFHAILVLSLVLCFFALGFGIFFYVRNAVTQVEHSVSSLSEMCADVIDGDQLRSYRDRVFADDETVLEDTGYRTLSSVLASVAQHNDLSSIFIGMPTPDALQFRFILNPDESNSTQKAGVTIDMDEGRTRTYQGVGDINNAIVLKLTDGTYACSAGAPVFASDGTIAGYVVCNVALTHIVEMSRTFVWQFVVVLAIVTFIVAFFVTWHIKRTVAAPINRLATAAAQYVQDKREGKDTTDHFASLNIKTGDEIENLSLIMSDMEQDLSEYEKNLTATTAEKERIGAELDIASQIQEGMLPNIFPPFPDRHEFDIYATMHPAKEVGGDFYDFFLIDDDHLALVIADVSGKGVPAAMFMMASKILIYNYAVIDGTSPARILEKVNHTICLNNKADMFVTVWLGILELSTGRLRAANAGHEFPVVERVGAGYELLRDKHGVVIGAMDGVRYCDYDVELSAGDSIFVYTDGVPEATDRDNSQYGVERMLAALNRVKGAECRTILEAVKGDIDAFVGDAPQFDDVTMLGVRYNGAGMARKTLLARPEALPEVLAFVDAALEEAECAPKAQMQIDVAVEELFVNIASYAYGAERGTAVVGVGIDLPTRMATITFADSGTPYDPFAKADPDITLSAEERSVGGLGVFMVKKTMDEVAYEYKNGQNVTTIRKKI